MRWVALLLLLAGCGSESGEPPPPGNRSEAEAAGPGRVPTRAELADIEGAATALRLYYEHIGRRDYRAAWALREKPPGLDYERFAASFAPYESYHANVGTPSFPAEADGYVWIDAPVQIWGREKDGRPFGSVGRIMLKRRSGSGDWLIAP